MKILIAHPSLLRLARVKHQVIALMSDADVLEASTLTDTYNLAEHYEPDLVIIAEDLAELAEFELLASLFRIMNIACIVLAASHEVPRAHPLFAQISMVPDDQLGGAIQKIDKTRQPTDFSAQHYDHSTPNSAAYDQNRMILIGASTGGIDALLNVSRHFDRHCPPVLIVQHTGAGFAKSLIKLLNGASPATVIAAQDHMSLAPGHVYLAPDDRAHLTVSPKQKPDIILQDDPAVSGHRPSVDALFTSALPHAPKVSAALLTGMGKDGAAGLTKLRQAGSHTIGQDQKTCVVYGMPRVAMEMGGVCTQLPIQDIGPALLKSCRARQRA
ncbi:CheB methylesterase [Yoonia maricola]|uniref:protein-glutamate methylesterase n=1 Tax=Yoonia maricola TaxID=420999 RepID=A0A2M8W1Z8_9RHOB|nr:CheB methylesterase domain-containing protein [Yoonia maricola]PJI84939.1 CheB methylesterase [Yoonia maricola]